MNPSEWTVRTGNPAQDQAHLEHYRQQAAAQGMALDVSPDPQGGFRVRTRPAGAASSASYGAPPAYGAPSPYGAPPAYGAAAPGAAGAAAFGAPMRMGAAGDAAPPQTTVGAVAEALGPARVRYLRKVYGLLTAAALVAVFAGYAVLELTPTVRLQVGARGVFQAPILVAYMLASPAIGFGVFGALFVGTFVASWVSKVKVLNVVALLGVAALMGVDMSAMIWIATLKADLGMSMMGSPVRDAGIVTAAVFLGATSYVFVAKKDFSFLGAILSMGGWVILGACLLTFVFHSETFVLAVASAGALFSALGLLWMTSYVLKHSDMTDPVGDALIFLVKLRNLFMFLLRIFMSSRD